jgi:hypothetical protein
MSLEISGYQFEGPYSIDTTVISSNRAAVYVIICKTSDGKNHVTDVGESGEVGVRIGNHDRKPCWERNCNSSLSVYLRYMPSSEGYTAADRRELESKIRNQYNPPCGQR